MKQLVSLLILCLSASWLAACAETPSPTAAPTAAPTPTKTATAQVDTVSLGETFEVGDARFTARSFTVESSPSVDLAAADFDGDGQLDLVVSGEPQLNLFRGDGKGGFKSLGHAPGGEQPVDFDLADLDADGDVDIVIANHDTDYLTILLGDGHGSFEPAPVSPLRIDVSPHPHAVRVADLDGDSLLDLVVDHRDGEGLLVLKGLGTGSFEAPGTLYGVGGDPYRGMAVGDIDGNGRLDLVTPNPGEVGVLFNVSDGRIAFVQGTPVAADAPFAVELGDINGDGRLDLIAASDEGSSLVELFIGDGNGGFEEAPYSPIDFAPGGKNIAVGDFDGDGMDDAVVACWQSPDVLVIMGGGDTIRTGTLPGGEHPWGLVAADLNGDGKDDLVIAEDTAPSAMVYLTLEQ